MTATLRVATRKGLFSFEKTANGWSIVDTAFIGDPVSMILTDARSGDRYAALNLGHFGVKLHRAAPSGAWQEIAVPKFPPVDDGSAGSSVNQIWSLVEGGTDRPGRLWAGTIPGALFKSEDRGDSWQLIAALWN